MIFSTVCLSFLPDLFSQNTGQLLIFPILEIHSVCYCLKRYRHMQSVTVPYRWKNVRHSWLLEIISAFE